MKVRVLKEFRDKKENVKRKKGDEFICSKERFEEINKTLKEKFKDVDWIEEVKEKKKSKGSK